MCVCVCVCVCLCVCVSLIPGEPGYKAVCVHVYMYVFHCSGFQLVLQCNLNLYLCIAGSCFEGETDQKWTDNQEENHSGRGYSESHDLS